MRGKILVLALLGAVACRPKPEEFSIESTLPNYTPPQPRSSISLGWELEPRPVEPSESDEVWADFGDANNDGVVYGLPLPFSSEKRRRYCDFDGEDDPRVLRGFNRSRLRSCYGMERPFAGKIMLGVDITAEGVVERVEIESSTLGADFGVIERCIVHRVLRHTFEPAKTATRASCRLTVGVDPPPEALEKRDDASDETP